MKERIFKEENKAILLAVILFFTMIRLGVAPSFGLGVDEAHYLLYARYLDISYLDHPPLVGWIHLLFGNGGAVSEFYARLPAIALMGVTSWVVYDFLLSHEVRGDHAVWGVAALNASFIFGALGLMLLPENLLLIESLLIVKSVEALEKEGSAKNYLLLGLWLGLAGLSKYTAILFVPSLLAYVAYKRRWDLLLTPKVLMTIGVAVVCILPVIVWNMRHGWISFLYQSDHVTGGQTVALKPFIKSFSGQFGAYNPLLFLLSLVGVWGAFKNRAVMALPLFIGVGVAVFFIGTSFLKPVLPHWSAIFYLIFIPYGVVWGMGQKEKIVKGVVIASVVLSVLIHGELALKIGTFGDYSSPFRDIVGYEGIVKKGGEIVEKDGATHKALGVLNWTYGSRWMAYNATKIPIFVLDEKNRQFELWNKQSPKGYDILIASSHFQKDDLSTLSCQSLETAGVYDTLLHGEKVDTTHFVWCRGYGGVCEK